MSVRGLSIVTLAVVLTCATATAIPPGGSEQEQQAGGTAGEGDACDYHTDCKAGLFCSAGACRPTEEVLRQLRGMTDESAELSAEEACGADRQCRINYLKQHNRASRRIDRIEAEQRAEEKIKQIQQQKLREFPRLDRPIGVDWRVSRLGALGVAAGYTFGGRLRGELQVASKRYLVNQTVSVGDSDISVNGDQRVTFIMPGVYYFFLEGDFSPYLGATFVYGRGDLSVSSFGDGGSVTSGELGTEYHAVGLHGGIDFQWKGNGFHSRLGLAYRPRMYHQARISAGNYSEPGRDIIDGWYDQMVRLDVVWLVGWNF